MVNITISGDMIKKLEALETWFYRRMLRISWKEKVTNVEVYCRMNTSTSLLIDIVHRQLTFLGHILRKGERENIVVTGFVDGKRETFLTYLSKIVFSFENLIEFFILKIMSDTGTGSDCTICVTNNGDIANVDKDFDLCDISVSSEGTVDLTDFDSLSRSNNGDVDIHVDDNNHTFSHVLKHVVL